MRSRVLGVSVGASSVAAALVEGRALRWAGGATYEEVSDLAEVIARLAGEAGRPVKRVRVALSRDLVQTRTLLPAPRLRARDVPAYVSLEAGRLFRKNGVPLVTSGALVAVSKAERALWAAATAEPLLNAILDGCAQAGLRLEAMAPAAETLPAALDLPAATSAVVIPNGSVTETLSLGIGGVWRSRLSPGLQPLTGTWVPALSAANGQSAFLAPAYAAGIRLPVLSLLPDGHRAARRGSDRRRLGMIAAAGGILWLLALTTYVGRLSVTYSRATTLLHAFRGAADSALEARRNLDDGRATLTTIAQARANRSRHLALLGALTRGLPDSVTLLAIQVAADGAVRITGHAPRATQVLAAVGRVPGLTNAVLEGAVTREAVPGVGEQDRFTVVAKAGHP